MIKLLKRLKKGDWVTILLSILFILVQVWMDLKLPAYMQKITLQVQTQGTPVLQILKSGAVMLLFALGSLLAACVTAICTARLAFSFGGNIRKALFHKIMSFSMEETGRFSTASLITRSTNDITQVQSMIVMGLQILIKAPITAAGAIQKISGSVWQWTLSTAIGVVILVAVVVGCVMLVVPKQRKVQLLTDDMNRVARENLTGIEVIRAYNAEQYVEDKFEKTNKALTSTNLFALRTMAFLAPSVQLIMNGMTLAVYWIGAVLISEADITEQTVLFANMLAFAQYAILVVNAFVMLTMIFTMIPRVLVSSNRINEVLDTEPSLKEGSGYKEPHILQETDAQQGMVEFKHVTFCYPEAGKPVLKDVSFRAEQGQTVAIIGSTGCGKSTVVNMIPRFFDATEGEILVNGVNVKEYGFKELREKIGYCPQQSIVFSGTVRSNVTYGCTASDVNSDTGIAMSAAGDNCVEKAVSTAQAAEFVEKMDGTYDASVAQGGANLSGGQRQRLSIARALAGKPEIMIFDDSFSALDYTTDRKLRETLRKNYKDITMIIVAQRIRTIRDADQILVMDGGSIIASGTHEELLAGCAVYRQIAESQNEVKEAIA